MLGMLWPLACHAPRRRSWIEGPKDKRKESDYCYLPKRWVHTWSGHTKGVNAIRFFPGTGHLLLSAGAEAAGTHAAAGRMGMLARSSTSLQRGPPPVRACVRAQGAARVLGHAPRDGTRMHVLA